MFLTSPLLAQTSCIQHGFFTRQGGVSSGIYASMNCGRGSSDIRDNVEENRNRIAAALGTSSQQLMSLYQVHGAEVITVTQCWQPTALPHADAMVTSMPGIALGILTADCVPVLFVDPEARIIGAAHAGWKGAFAGVLENTIRAMVALGATRTNILAAIGPAIAQPSYEVDNAFFQRFVTNDPSFTRFFIPSIKPEHWMFDVKGFARNRLTHAGIQHINLLENDTYLEEDAFFSFRRTTHRGETDYGRHISAIMLT